MPPDRLPWDRKDFFKDRKHDRSTPRWRDSSSTHYGSSRDFSRWGGSNEFRRPPGHAKQGGWHLFAEDSGRSYAPFRSNDRILDDKNYRPSISRGDGKYGRNSRDNRGSFSSQRDWKAHSWEMSNGSPNTAGRLHDVSSDQRPLDDVIAYPSPHSHSELGNKWDQLHPKEQHDNSKMVGVSAGGTGQRGDRESSLDWKPLKWARTVSLSSRGSGFSHSSSSKSVGGGDSSEGKADLQLKNASFVQSPSGEAAACVTSAPSEDMSARKKPRLNWGEGLAKYEKKKVDGPEVNGSKYETIICYNIEPIPSQSSNLADKSPRVLGLSDCASPATPSSVACSSPGMEEKTLGKGISVDNDVSNLCSPSVGPHSHCEGLSFNLEVLDDTSLSNLGASLVELLQSDDSSSVDSSFVRSTLINKLHILKGDISKALEVTESEIDSLESELKLLKFEAGSRCRGTAASSFFQVVHDVCNEREAVSSDIPRPSPLQVSCGPRHAENSSLYDGILEVHVDMKDDDVDSPGTATSKFVEPVSVVKMGSSSDMVKSDECSQDRGVIEIPTMVSKSSIPPANGEGNIISACGDVSMLIEGNEVAPHPSSVSFSNDNLCNLILAANKESASRASEELYNCLPRNQCKVDFSEVSKASLWQNDTLVKEKFLTKKRFLRFKERVVTLKFKAYQHLWKEDMRLLSLKKYRAKSQKKYELSLRTMNSGHKKNRSSIRSRFSSPAGNLSLVPTAEMLDFTSKLLPVSQNKLYRNSLKMPALILDKREREVSRFVSCNGLVEDPCAVEKERALINPWTSEEKELFIDKLAAFGKDFKKIASFLDHKTTADCVEFYYKNHKSDCFEKTKKSKKVKSSTNYLMSSGKNWNREMNAASLDILGAASVIAADVDNSMGNRQICSGRIYLGGYCGPKISHANDANFDQSSNFDMLENERETVAADVLAGICGSMSSEAMSSCITTSVDLAEGGREWKSQKVDSVKKRPSASDVTQNVDEDTCSDDSCGEMDPSDWTDEEKSIFMQAVSSYGKDFDMISQCVRTRSRDQCKVFFGKARKCLGLDSIHPGAGNLGTPVSDDGNGGGSDTDDGCALETGTVICSEKLGSKMDEVLPLPVVDEKHEKSNAAERQNVTDDLNKLEENMARSPEQHDYKDEKSFVSDACKVEDKSEIAFYVNAHQAEIAQGQEISNESVNSEAEREKPTVDSISVGEQMSVDAVDPDPSNPVLGSEVTAITPEVANESANHMEQKEVLLPVNDLNSQSGLMQDSSCTGDANQMPLDAGSSSNLRVDVKNTHLVSKELCSVEESSIASLPQDSNLASADSRLQDSVAVKYERVQIDENREGQGKKSCSGDEHFQHFPGEYLMTSCESSQILSYPLQIPIKREMNGDIFCRPLYEVQKSLSASDSYLHKCNSSSKAQSSLRELPPLPQHSEQGADHSREQSRSLSDTEKPYRNGDVKLFGKILSNPMSSTQKTNPGLPDSVENCSKASSKSSTLKFSGHRSTDGSSSILKFDRNNYLGLENMPVKSFGFWDGNKIQTGYSSLPEYFLAKYPAAFSNYDVSSSKMGQQAAVKCNDRSLNGVSVVPPREMSGSNGIVDYRMYKGNDNSKVQPFSVDVKQRQDIFTEMQRRDGYEALSSMQQQGGRGVVGMNVVGRGGILVGGACTSVSDPVAALKMHYAKAEQYGRQNGAAMMREEESWRSKGDIGR